MLMIFVVITILAKTTGCKYEYLFFLVIITLSSYINYKVYINVHKKSLKNDS